jgi:hypothetical protein
MNIVLTEEQLRVVLSEMVTKRKDPFSMEGSQHMIYDSKKNPNIVFKIGHPGFVDSWLSIFKKRPQYFPEIYRVGIVKDKHEYKYVEMEKLDTKRVKEEWEKITLLLIDAGLIDEDNIFDNNLSDVFRNCILDEEYDNDVIQKIKNLNRGQYQLFIKWSHFLHRLNSFVEPIKGSMLDIHDGNYGYDKQGNIKCFDI